MNNNTKLILAIMLLISVSSFVQANNTNQNKKGSHQRPTFESIDTNADGDIDFEEFSAHKLPYGDHQTVFDNIDFDTNGIISNVEFVNHKPPQRKYSKDKQ